MDRGIYSPAMAVNFKAITMPKTHTKNIPQKTLAQFSPQSLLQLQLRLAVVYKGGKKGKPSEVLRYELNFTWTASLTTQNTLNGK